MKTAIIGGGAAGFFLAINLKEMCPDMEVTIFEAAKRVLAKVEVSGGGRCNCTNSFEGVSDLQQVYPRGHRLMKRLFKTFDYRDAFDWFEQHGVALVTQDDHCVFPRSQDSHTIINLFLSEAHRLGIPIETGRKIQTLDEISDFDFVALTTGGLSSHLSPLVSHLSTTAPVPSLFTFSIDDERLHALMGTVVETATAMIPGTKMRADGPLLITHWGMSGPSILRLSSYAARMLYDADYHMPLVINWLSMRDQELSEEIEDIERRNPQKLLSSVSPCGLQQRLWHYLLEKALGGRAHAPWCSLNKKEVNRLVTVLTNDNYKISERAPFKDEFVTCGGISLDSIDPVTLESKEHPRLFFAGEVLDIDGVTGGFNFQCAWTTAYTVACAITMANKTTQKLR